MIKACVAKAKTLQDGEAETEKKRKKVNFLFLRKKKKFTLSSKSPREFFSFAVMNELGCSLKRFVPWVSAKD